jgi:hypothetical protein
MQTCWSSAPAEASLTLFLRGRIFDLICGSLQNGAGTELHARLFAMTRKITKRRFQTLVRICAGQAHAAALDFSN